MFEDKKAEGIEYQYIYSTFEQPAEVFFSRAVRCFDIGRKAIDFAATKRRTRLKNPSFLQYAGHCKEFPKTVFKNRS